MERMRADQRVTLCGSDAAALVEVWRDVFKQYQSTFEQNESLYKITTTFLLTIPSWVRSHSGVSVTGVADVAVPVDDLRPRNKNVQTTLDAIEDIRFTAKLLDKWMPELDKCVAIRFSPHNVPSYDNNGFTESRVTPITQANESKRCDYVLSA